MSNSDSTETISYSSWSTGGPTTSTATTNSNPTAVHFVGFNQDHGCFAAGVDRGFRIFNSDPYMCSFGRDFSTPDGVSAGVGIVAMLFRCNIMAVVGGGPRPLHPPNKVMIWDDHASRYAGELSFRSEVRGVKLRNDRIFVVTLQSVFVYNFTDFKLVQQFETVANPKGLLEVSLAMGPNTVMVCPGLQKGQVRVEQYGLKKTLFFTAHDSKVTALGLTLDGKLIATASSKGTLIRIFNTSDCSLLREVRRGVDRANICNIAFSCNPDWGNQWLAVSSDKGTVHVFNLTANSGSLRNKVNPANTSRLPSFSLLKGVLPRYFSSEWSTAQFRLPEGLEHIVGFGSQQNTIVIVGTNGSFYRCQFDPENGGEMTQLEHYNFLKPEGSP